MAHKHAPAEVSAKGEIIQFKKGKVVTPTHPVVLFIEGDGIGAEISTHVREMVDASMVKAYKGERSIVWKEAFAGDKAKEKFGTPMPKKTLRMLKKYRVALKGPLATPSGGGMRSLNVYLRSKLDLYQCIRPVRYYPGVPSPVKRPQDLDIVIFRQNDEDVYAGIEFKAKSKKAKKLRKFLNKMGADIRKDSAIGIKPLSEFGSKRLITRAIEYAIEHGRTSVTLVGKGNIQKYTEGAFQAWGMEVAKKKFKDKVISWAEVKSKYNGKLPEDKIALKMVVIDEKIADATFADLLGRPTQFSVIATTNLNGDYLSDAAAAQVGGLGIAPGANIGKNLAIFEATHGTAPDIAGQNKANPCSLLLSAKMMLDYLGYHEAADILEKAMQATIAAGTVTGDLARLMEKSTTLGTDQFSQKITDYIRHSVVNGEKVTSILN